MQNLLQILSRLFFKYPHICENIARFIQEMFVDESFVNNRIS